MQGFVTRVRREQHLLCIADDSLIAVPAPPFHEVSKIPFMQLFEIWIVALEVVCTVAISKSQQLQVLSGGCVHARLVKAKRRTREDSCDICCCKPVYQEPTVRRLPSCWITHHSSRLVNSVCGSCHAGAEGVRAKVWRIGTSLYFACISWRCT